MNSRTTYSRFSISPPPTTVESLRNRSWFPNHPPYALSLEKRDANDLDHWARKIDQAKVAQAEFEVGIGTETSREFIVWRRPSNLAVRVPTGLVPSSDWIAECRHHPFRIAVLGSLIDWMDEMDFMPSAYHFADGHPRHGFLVAFRGEGHDRLVSRKWLEHGPWLYLRREDLDLSVVVFHDPDLLDPEEAVQQAYPGHERMGISKRGGYIHPRHDYGEPIQGTYLAHERRFVVLVLDREVPERELLDAAALRLHSQDTEQPIDTVTYTFLDEANAKKHLHELWLRDIECRAVICGEETRLDIDYDPQPEPPAWTVPLRSRLQAVLDNA